MLRESVAMFAILCAFTGSLAQANTIVNSANSGVFYCGVCKYAQGKVEYTANTVKHLSWWGSTASGKCDTTNDVKRWQLQGTALYNDETDIKIFNYTSGKWRTNCERPARNAPPWAYFVSPNKRRPSKTSAHFWWMFEKKDGRKWFEYVRLNF